MACLVIRFGGFRKVYPIHLERLFLIASSLGNLSFLCQNRLLLMIFGQWIFRILGRQLFVNTYTFSVVVVLVS